MPAVAPVDPRAVADAVVVPGGALRAVECVPETGSTNADLARRAAAGGLGGAVLIAEHQTAGRGRFTRRWEEAPGSGISMSVLLEPTQPLSRWGWLPLLLGLSVRDGVAEATGAPVLLKWPNDVLLEDGPAPGKLCGLLAEVARTPHGNACVLGMGINVAMAVDELPVPTATSLLLAGFTPTKTQVASAVLSALDGWFRRFEAGEDLRDAYTAHCATVGRRVRVQLDAERGRGEAVEGVCVGVDAEGSLEVRTDDGTVVAFTSGDALHVR